MGLYKTYRSTGTHQRAVLVTGAGDDRASEGEGTGNREPARDRVLLRVVFVSGNDAFVCVRCVRPIEIWFRLD